MSQARAIETNSNLRLLPLPGRVEGSGVDAPLNGTRAAADAVSGLSAARGIAGQSRKTESFVAVNYDATINVPQPAANVAAPISRAPSPKSGVDLADDVVGFLLSANEVKPSQPQGAQQLRTGTRAYQEVSNVFPRTQNSLFSLAT